MENTDLNLQERILLGVNGGVDLPDLDFGENDPDEVSEMLGKMHKLQRAIRRHGKKVKIDRHAIKQEIGASRQRLQVLDRIELLPKDMQKDLIKGRAQISDKVLYSAIKMSEIQDGKLIPTDKGVAIGQRNFSNAKYGHWFLLQGIQILFDSNSISGNYDDALPDPVFNGEISILGNSKTLLDGVPVSSFAQVQGYPISERLNYYKVKNPKWLIANKDVQAKLAMPSDYNNGYIKVLMFGQEVRPY